MRQIKVDAGEFLFEIGNYNYAIGKTFQFSISILISRASYERRFWGSCEFNTEGLRMFVHRLRDDREARFRLARTGIFAAALYMTEVAAGYAAPVDLGSYAYRAGDQTISVTIALKLRDAGGAEAMMRRIATPGDSLYQQFMTPQQVQAQFGPNENAVASVIAWLQGHGLSVERTSATTLKATAAVTVMERAFQTSLHQFQMPATDKTSNSTFRAPVNAPVVPPEIAPAVWAVFGLSTKPAFRPHSRHAPNSLGNMAVQWSANPTVDTAVVNSPGFLTVTDFAARYNVNPLYRQGVTGRGRTLGIVTLANFTPSDVFEYWSSLNLNVDPNRLTVVNIDNGPGPPSDASDSSETTLDVEQSGGVAPGANIIVYQAPNTDQGFLDAFAAAIESNNADTISVSWGLWEFFYREFATVTDPFSGQFVTFAQATHELFIEAALQGQSLFAAAGDFGAFDTFAILPPPFFTFPLSVDFPAADTAITAVGGTTLPATLTVVAVTTGVSFPIKIPTERVWGWDYLKPVCDAQELDPISCGIFPVGGGGGVSVFSPVPFYQAATAGVQTSERGQVLVEEDTTPPNTIFDLPAKFRGRNVPDVSFNADPLTGYTVFYTSDVFGFEIRSFDGGASFVAPQLNGVAALLAQNAGHRLGFLNPLLYRLGMSDNSQGQDGVLNTISTGDNWFYSGRNGYSPAAGLGTINVNNLAKVLK